MSVRCSVALAATAAVVVLPNLVQGRDAFSQYGQSWRTVALPPVGTGSFDVRADFFPDGRIVGVTGSSIFLERSPHSAQFDVVGTLDAAEIGVATDPSFLRVSPDGLTIGVGAGFGKPVAVFPVAALGTPGAPAALTSGGVARYYHVAHYDAAWQDATHLGITAGDFGAPALVSLLDTTSSPAAPLNPIIISNIGGASSGIVFDPAGRLYTGNGFDLDTGSGSNTGALCAFTPDLWAGGAANFELQGVAIGEVLSAAALLLDREGNLIVGGGDFSGDSGYLGVINAQALAAALAGLGPIDSADPLELLRLHPVDFGLGYYGSAYDASTGELFATATSTWYGTIPGPSGAMLCGLCGAICTRRRRHA